MAAFYRCLMLIAFCASQALGGSSDITVDSSQEQTPDKVQDNPPAYGRVSLPAEYFHQYGSKRTMMKYGPFHVGSMADADGMIDYIQLGAELPCTDCMITFLQAGLEYPDGSYANANTSLWLHHTVIVDLLHNDTVCGFSYPAGEGQRWFASGNERTPVDFTVGGKIPAGYYLDHNDEAALVLELMNQEMTPQEAVLTITFEWVPGKPSNFYEITPMWLDIGGCEGSDMPAKSSSTFQYTSPTYKSKFSGAVVATAGHLHDGGVYIPIKKNDEPFCNSVALYGQTSGYFDAPGTSMVMPMDPNFSPMEHISEMTRCYAPTVMNEPGDEWSLTAYYNFTEHMPMLNSDGSFAEIMGISLVFVATNMTEEEMHGFVGTQTAPLYPVPAATGVAAMDSNMDNMPAGSPMRTTGLTCVPARDSPGTITTAGLDMSDRQIAMDYLMAILNDTCLQVWSGAYARYFWYTIVAFIGVCALWRALEVGKLASRKRMFGKDGNGSESDRFAALTAPAQFMAAIIRAVSYRQLTPTSIKSSLRIPNFGHIFIIIVYFALLLILEFINVSTGDNQTWQSMGVRAGWLSVAQLPLLILLANKRNLIGLVTGVTFERLNILHRWVARGLLLTTTLHFGLQSTGWAKAGVMKLEWNTDTCPPTGMAAYALVLWMNLSTLAPIRNWNYEFFVIQHIITFMGTFVAIAYHIPSTATYARTYVYIASALYICSRAVQFAIYTWNNVRPGRAELTTISNNVTKVTIKGRRLRNWPVGSHVFLSIPKLGLLQSHPATIASTPTSENGEMIFYLRKHSGFTKRISQCTAQTETKLALVDGPYGGGQLDMAAYHTAFLIAGSTGISFTLPLLLDMAHRSAQSKLPLREVHFVWATKDRAFVTALESQIRDAVNTLRNAGMKVFVHIHSTEDTAGSDVSWTFDEEGMTFSEKGKVSPTVLSRANSGSSLINGTGKIAFGRPHLPTLLNEADLTGVHDMAVTVCGPLSISAQVRNHVASMQPDSLRRDLYLHVEGFGW